MNEKHLWELWEKCKHPHPKHGGEDMVWPMEFANLIIKECIAVVENEEWSDPDEVFKAIDLIEQHFGISNESKD